MDRTAEAAGRLGALYGATQIQRGNATLADQPLGIRNAAGNDEQTIFVGHAAFDCLDGVVDALDNQLYAHRLCQSHRLHADLVGCHFVRDDKNGIGSQGMAPGECDLAVEQPVVHPA